MRFYKTFAVTDGVLLAITTPEFSMIFLSTESTGDITVCSTPTTDDFDPEKFLEDLDEEVAEGMAHSIRSQTGGDFTMVH